MKHNLRSTFITILKFLVAGGLLYYGIHKGWLEQRHIDSMIEHWPLAAAGVAGIGIIPVIGAIRWRALVRAQGIDLSVADAFRLTYIGFFWSVFLPGAVSGDFFKAYYIARGLGREKKAEAVTTIFVDRIVGLMALTILAAVVVPMNIPAMRQNAQLRTVALVICGAFAAGIVSLAVIFSKRLRAHRKSRLASRGRFWQIADRVDDAVHLYRDHKLTILWTVGVSVMLHTVQCLVLWLYVVALVGSWEGISAGKMLLLGPMGFMVNSIPVSPGGAGWGEWFFQHLLESQGIMMGYAAFLCWRLTNLLAVSPGAIIWILHRSELAGAADQPGGEPGPEEAPSSDATDGPAA